VPFSTVPVAVHRALQYIMTVTQPIFTKLALLTQFAVKKFCAELHEIATGGSVAATRSQSDVVFAHSTPVT